MREEKRTDKDKRGDRNPDPITGAPGSHPVGTGVGAAAGGAAAGAAIGSVAGPVGTTAGIAAGAIIGGLAGKGVAEAIDPTAEEAYWREHHAEQWYGRDRGYDEYRGAYRTGYEGYGRYGREGRTFEQSEADLQRDYERNRGTSKLTWDEGRDAARAAWHKVHGRWERLIDYDVQDQTKKKIGTVHNLWADDNGQPTFLGVKTGWIFGKNHVVPVHTATVNDQKRIIRLPFTEQKIKDAPAFDADCDLSDADEQRVCSHYNLDRAAMQLAEEQVKVGKRELTAGGVRLRKVVRSETVNQPVELRREDAVIERVPASGAQAGKGSFQEEDVFIPLRREEAEEIAREGDARYATESGQRREGARYERKERSR